MSLNEILNIVLIVLTVLSTLVGYYFKIKEKKSRLNSLGFFDFVYNQNEVIK